MDFVVIRADEEITVAGGGVGAGVTDEGLGRNCREEHCFRSDPKWSESSLGEGFGNNQELPT